MKKILIIGATSAIAEATARLWAKRGYQIFLVARDKKRLDILANDLSVRNCFNVLTYTMDATDLNAHQAMLDNAEKEMLRIDVVLIAYGTLSDQAECQQSVAVTLQEINNNALSVIALLTLIANKFEQQRHGVIAVISSVAGDRVRQSNYVYGSSKAMVTAFTSGLRQRLFASGVTVLTIKPGFVDTPMTNAFRKGVLWVSPDKVALDIESAISNSKDVIYTPQYWRLIMFVIRSIPEVLFKRMKL